LDGSGWVRPVGTHADGTLFPSDITLQDGSAPHVLDVLEIGLKRPRPEDHHPENWVIDGRRWRLLARPMDAWSDWISRQPIETGPMLFGGFDDRIPFGAKVSHSLALLRIMDLHWRIMVGDDRRKLRVRFMLAGQLYDLGVTDDQLEGRFSTWAQGVYPLKLAPGFEDAGEALMTVSLGEQFAPVEDGPAYCFKLAAAVIPMARAYAENAREVPHKVDEHSLQSYDVETVRQSYAHAYMPWSEEEERLLCVRFKSGARIPQLVKEFQRQPGGIVSRLKKLGLLLDDARQR